MINLNRRFFLQGMSLSLLPIGAAVSAKENRNLFSTISINKEDVLLIIDVQNDFCPGGSLAVKDGDKIIEGINTVQKSFKNIILSQDWHPSDHSSFYTSHEGKEPFSTIQMPYGEQTLWPPHCVIGSKGAEFHSKLALSGARMVIRKGFRREVDSYSAFWENGRVSPTGLEGALKTMGIRRVFVCGLALDFCVAYTAVDSALAGFDTYVIVDLCKPVNLPGTVEATFKAFNKHGVKKILLID